MIHQDLITCFNSSSHVDRTYIKGRPCLDDLTRFERGSLGLEETQGSTSEGNDMIIMIIILF